MYGNRILCMSLLYAYWIFLCIFLTNCMYSTVYTFEMGYVQGGNGIANFFFKFLYIYIFLIMYTCIDASLVNHLYSISVTFESAFCKTGCGQPGEIGYCCYRVQTNLLRYTVQYIQ